MWCLCSCCWWHHGHHLIQSTCFGVRRWCQQQSSFTTSGRDGVGTVSFQYRKARHQLKNSVAFASDNALCIPLRSQPLAGDQFYGKLLCHRASNHRIAFVVGASRPKLTTLNLVPHILGTKRAKRERSGLPNVRHGEQTSSQYRSETTKPGQRGLWVLARTYSANIAYCRTGSGLRLLCESKAYAKPHVRPAPRPTTITCRLRMAAKQSLRELV